MVCQIYFNLHDLSLAFPENAVVKQGRLFSLLDRTHIHIRFVYARKLKIYPLQVTTRIRPASSLQPPLPGLNSE